MPKRKKTRKEKIVADVRRETNPVPVYTVPAIVLTKKSSVPQHTTHTAKPVTIATTDYHYLSKDLLKTGIFTGVIVALELVLHFFLKGV